MQAVPHIPKVVDEQRLDNAVAESPVVREAQLLMNLFNKDPPFDA